LSADEFKTLLWYLGSKELLMQDRSGLLLHGRVGEKLVNHYTFYAAFASDEEFRIVASGKTLGSLPISQVLTVGQHILFAGKTWRVEEVSEQEKTIYVTYARGGAPPLFSGGVGRTHTRVRQKMRELLAGSDSLPFLDETAQRFFREGRDAYKRLDLDSRVFLDLGSQVMVMTWQGDAANEAIACLLNRRGFKAWPAGPGVEVLKGKAALEELEAVLADAAVDEPPPLDLLLADAKNLEREKWDWALPQPLLQRAYGSLYLDLLGAYRWLTKEL
jgi:ATP-dependent helicase Lhr and Lhr-like helicase